MVKFQETEYKNFGRCLAVTNGAIEIYVTLDIGPRIIKCNLNGMENLMFNDINREVSEDVSSAFGDDKRWYIYGGHRLWVSPEDMPLTYYPDNERVEYKITGNSVVFTPSDQKVNELRHIITIEPDESKPEVSVTHSVTNIGDKTAEGAIWALSVMAPDGTVICPLSARDTGLLGNRVIALWPYTKINDDRMMLTDKYVVVRQNPSASGNFKIGFNNDDRWGAYANRGQLFVKTFPTNHPCGIYPDGGMSCEVFTNRLFIELESLSELNSLKRGETMTHTEKWRLSEAPAPEFKSPADIEAYAAKYIL